MPWNHFKLYCGVYTYLNVLPVDIQRMIINLMVEDCDVCHIFFAATSYDIRLPYELPCPVCERSLYICRRCLRRCQRRERPLPTSCYSCWENKHILFNF